MAIESGRQAINILQKLFDKITDKALDQIIDKYWLPAIAILWGLLSIVEGWLTWAYNLPWILKLPLICSIPVLFLVGIALVNLIKDVWGFTKRTKAIKRGASIVFENKDAQWVTNVVKDWANSSAEPDIFSEERNYQRIRSDYTSPVKQLITLTASYTSEQNPTDPILYMTIKRAEFIRWLKDNPDIPIPKAWYENHPKRSSSQSNSN